MNGYLITEKGRMSTSTCIQPHSIWIEETRLDIPQDNEHNHTDKVINHPHALEMSVNYYIFYIFPQSAVGTATTGTLLHQSCGSI